ncbi:MAG: methyl-accepting chemotaxis protein [Oscillospiraceae bacterium]
MKKAIKQSTASRIFALLSIFSLILTFAMIFCMTTANKRLDDMVVDKAVLTENANNFKNASAYLTNEVRAYAATGNVSHYDNYWHEVNNAKNRDIAVANMKEVGLSDEEIGLIEEISATSNNLIPLEEQAMKLAQSDFSAQAISVLYSDNYFASTDKISSLTNSFFESISTRTDASIARINFWVSIFTYTSYASLLLVFVVQLLMISFVTKKLLKPIIAIKENMQLMAGGDLTTSLALEEDTSEVGQAVSAVKSAKSRLKVIIDDIGFVLGEMAGGNFTVRSESYDEYKGEYIQIMDSMRALGIGQKNTLSQISTAADQVSSGSDQVASGAQELSQGATEQASSVEELSATVTQLTSQIATNAEHAASANSISNETSTEVEIGNRKMSEMMDAMKEITEKSGEIGKIIKTIEDIAFQTNILALNAAVEAARAGSAGKGFAVVADEVRNLAQKSAEAAKNTTALIEGSITAVENGTKIADDTAKSLSIIVEKVNSVKDVIAEIATASAQQAEGASQISIGIDQISSVTQTNSATAEQSAAASEELSSQSEMLKNLMSKYRL